MMKDDPIHTSPAAALYTGEVMHARLKPMGHRFSYRVMSLLIDLDRLDQADTQSRLFGVNRAALYSFNEKDHGNRDAAPLNAYVRACGREHGLDLDGGRTLLLCYPRLFGYTFNPLSVYFCYDKQSALAMMIYEVRNTLGAIHSYVLPVAAGQSNEAGIRQEQDKLFYVSPFIEMAMHYRFRVTPPDEAVKIRILETDDDGPLLAATFHGTRRPLTSTALLRSFVALPLMTFKIVGAIHWEALRLWFKGAKYIPETKAHSANGPLAKTPPAKTSAGAHFGHRATSR